MKLILASDLSFLLKYGYNLTGIPKEKMRIGWVTTASKGARSAEFIMKVRESMKENGINYEEIDIKGKSPNEIINFFENKNVIHVEGGNTFYLLKAIREVGFDRILKNMIDEGKIYIGTSAGSYVMCPSIEVSDWNDETVDRFGVTDFTALNYVPFVMKVHYKDTPEARKDIEEKVKKLRYPLRILRDGEGILVEDDKYTFFGENDEVKI
jgi:dipeptidase E